jgi:hypothetical protein
MGIICFIFPKRSGNKNERQSGRPPGCRYRQHPEFIKKSNILRSFADKINIYL